MPNTQPPSRPIYDSATGPRIPKRLRTPEQEREYNRLRKAASRAGEMRCPVRRPALSNLAALDDPDADPRAPVPLVTRVSLALRQRLDNASHALSERSQSLQSSQWTQRAIIERAIEDALDRIEAQHNGHVPFPDPPSGHGCRERSRRTTAAREKKRAAST